MNWEHYLNVIIEGRAREKAVAIMKNIYGDTIELDLILSGGVYRANDNKIISAELIKTEFESEIYAQKRQIERQVEKYLLELINKY